MFTHSQSVERSLYCPNCESTGCVFINITSGEAVYDNTPFAVARGIVFCEHCGLSISECRGKLQINPLDPFGDVRAKNTMFTGIRDQLIQNWNEYVTWSRNNVLVE